MIPLCLLQGKIIACYRKKWEIHIERLQRDKTNGATVNIGFHPSKVEVVNLKIDKSRKQILERKNRSTGDQKVRSFPASFSPLVWVLARFPSLITLIRRSLIAL